MEERSFFQFDYVVTIKISEIAENNKRFYREIHDNFVKFL